MIDLEKVVSPDSECGLNLEELIQEGMQLVGQGVSPGAGWCHPAVCCINTFSLRSLITDGKAGPQVLAERSRGKPPWLKHHIALCPLEP